MPSKWVARGILIELCHVVSGLVGVDIRFGYVRRGKGRDAGSIRVGKRMVLGPEIRDVRLDKGEIKPPHTSADSIDNRLDWSVPGLDADLLGLTRSRFNIVDIRSRGGDLGV